MAKQAKKQLDAGHKYAAEQLEFIESRIKKEYSQALIELKVRANKYFEKFTAADAKMIQKLNANLITVREYKEWRKKAMILTRKYEGMINQMSHGLTHTNQVVMNIIAGKAPTIYIENYNFGGFEISEKLNANLTFTLADQNTLNRLLTENGTLLPAPRVDIPKDLKWNQEHIRSALTQGILQGDSIPHIADRLQSVTDMTRAAAIRNARTMTTGAENAGRIDSYHYAADLGIDVQKEWMATLDQRTRDSHREIDGQVREIDKRFSNGLMYPGDPSGAPEEVYNCRCTLVSRIVDSEHDYTARYAQLGDMSYEEWKRGKNG